MQNGTSIQIFENLKKEMGAFSLQLSISVFKLSFHFNFE